MENLEASVTSIFDPLDMRVISMGVEFTDEYQVRIMLARDFSSEPCNSPWRRVAGPRDRKVTST